MSNRNGYQLPVKYKQKNFEKRKDLKNVAPTLEIWLSKDTISHGVF